MASNTHPEKDNKKVNTETKKSKGKRVKCAQPTHCQVPRFDVERSYTSSSNVKNSTSKAKEEDAELFPQDI